MAEHVYVNVPTHFYSYYIYKLQIKDVPIDCGYYFSFESYTYTEL